MKKNCYLFFLVLLITLTPNSSYSQEQQSDNIFENETEFEQLPRSEELSTEEFSTEELSNGEISPDVTLPQQPSQPDTPQSTRRQRTLLNREEVSWIVTFWKWMQQLIAGSYVTIGLTISAVSAGLILSLFLALGKMSKNIVINKACSAYIFFFRGTPLLMQLFFIYYALPMIAPVLTINSRFLAAFIAFSLNAAAYLAEIIRAAIQSIDKGQFEASRALGLSYGQTMRLIIIPQSIRRLIPPVGNEFIMMLKDASLVSMIALVDITKATRNIEGSTRSAMVYIPAMILYLIITAIFTFVFHKLEKKYSVYE